MINIEVLDRKGKKRSLQIEENPSGSLMEVLTEQNFDLPAICGGIASCGTCHIRVLKGLDKLRPPEEDETFMLDGLFNLSDESRLSCQIRLTEALEGAEIQILGEG